VDELRIFFGEESAPFATFNVVFDNAMSGETTLDEFGK
jgi:hypothetical protein